MPRKKKASPAKVYATGKKIKKERLEKRKANIVEATAATAAELKNTPRTPVVKEETPKPTGRKKSRAYRPEPIPGSDAKEIVQEVKPGAPDFSSEGARSEIMKAAAKARDAEIGTEKKYDLSEIPTGPDPEKIKNTAAEDPRLTPKLTVEPLPSENQAELARRRNAPLARPQRSGVLTGGTPERYRTPLTDPTNDQTRERRGMGIAGEEKGIVSHAISLLNRDNEVLWRKGKLFEKPKIATSYEDVRDTHQHRLAKVLHTFNVSEDALQAHAEATKGGSRRAYEDTVEELHSATQEHNDFYGKKVTLVPGPNDLWEHPTLTDERGVKRTFPVSANHPDMPRKFERSKQPITRLTRGSDGGLKYKRGHEGWDSFNAAGTKVWRQQTAPEGMDLVDHLRKEVLDSHAAGSARRERKVRNARTVLDSLAGGKTVIGMRERGRATPGTGIPTARTEPTASTTPRKRNAVTVKYDAGQNSVSEALIAAGDPPTGLPTGKEKTARAPKATSGRVRVTKGTRGLPISSSNMATKEAEVETEAGTRVTAKSLLKPLVDKNAMLPSKVPGAAVVPEPKKVKQTTEEKALARAKKKDAAAKVREGAGVGPLQKNQNWAGKPAFGTAGSPQNPQLALPGFENVENMRVGARAQRLLAETHGMVPKETTGLEDVRAMKAAGIIQKPTPSPSREVAVREGGPRTRAKAKAAAIDTRNASRPMEQPMLPGKELRSAAFALGGSSEKVSEKTRELQGAARKPSKPTNDLYVAANKILEENKEK